MVAAIDDAITVVERHLQRQPLLTPSSYLEQPLIVDYSKMPVVLAGEGRSGRPSAARTSNYLC